jgi:DNA-binding beta-propeller fold protein YncE
LYILTADSPSTLYQLSTDNQVTITSRTLPAKGVELAVSNDGKHVYVVSEPVAPKTLRRLLVLDATQPSMPDFNTKLLELPNSATGEVKLAVAPDGRVLTHVAASGAVFRWGADLDTSPTPADPALVQTLTGNPVGLTLSTDGQQAFFLGPGNQIQSLKLSDGTVNKITTTLPNTAKLSSMALVSSGGKDLLAMADATSLKLHLFDTGAAQALLGSVTLDHKPIGLVASPVGGHWVYVLEKDTAGSFVQPVSVAGMQKTPPDPPGKAFPVGADSQQIIINNSATRLYIPYVDNLTNPSLGGVAVVEVSEEACGEILWRDLEGCAHCDQPNCIVLATIENYHLDDQLWDPPADTATDATRHIDRINNRTRRLLPSTQALAELVTCLLEHPAGAGSQGPVGPTGPAGAGVDSTDAVTIAAGLPAVADFDPIARRIHFKIPKGDKGDPGASGGTGLDDVELTIANCSTASSAQIAVIENQRVLRLVIPSICDRNLTQISGVNWVHGGTISADAVNRQGLLLAFNHPVRGADLHDQSVMVLARQSAAQRSGCWCEVPGRINAVEFRIVGDVLSDFRLSPPATSVNGVQFSPGAAGFTPGTYRVIVKGDFILDAATLKAVDADHLPPWFATPAKHFKIGDYTTGDGVQGGTFESWFTVG